MTKFLSSTMARARFSRLTLGLVVVLGATVWTHPLVAVADTTSPTVSTVAQTTAIEDTVTPLSVTYADNVGVSECEFSIIGIGGSDTMTLSGGKGSSSGTAIVNYTFSEPGTYAVYATCSDAMGNSNSATPSSIVVASATDTTEPTVSAVTPTTATESTALTLEASYADNVGVTACTLYIDGEAYDTMTLSGGSDSQSGTASIEYTFNDDGAYSAHVICVDAEGNANDATAAAVTVAARTRDTSAPSVGTATPATATTNQATTISATYSDNIGVMLCSLMVDDRQIDFMSLSGGEGSSSGTATVSHTFTSSGTYTVNVVCFDNVDNMAISTDRSVVVSATSSDTTAPLVTSLSATTSVVNVATTITATYSDAIGVTSCNLYVDGSTSSSSMTLSSGTTTGTTTFTSTGSHSARVKCSDAAGNVGSSSILTISVSSSSDTTGPTVSLVTPTTATQDVARTYTATVSDPSGVYACRLHVNSNDQGAMTSGTSGTYSRSYTHASSSNFTVRAVCSDNAGNTTNGTSATVTVTAATSTTSDATAPTVGAITPFAATEAEPIILSASVADSGGMDTCILYVNSTRIGDMSISNGYATYLYTFNAAGSAIANAYCTDDAGNATRGASTTLSIAAAVDEVAEETADRGSLVKLACTANVEVNDPCTTVYYYGLDGQRHVFPNEQVFFSWRADYDDVIIVTDDFMSSLTLGNNITYRPGALMVKFLTNDTVYAVAENGELRAIMSEDLAASIYGDNWNRQIDDISDAFYGNYEFGETIDNVRDYDADEVYDSVNEIDDIL